MSVDIESWWEYGDPGGSEERFRGQIEAADSDERLELLTQVARTYSLRKRFEDAHQLLEEVNLALDAAGVRPRIRYLLEKGRTFNSGGEKETARALFEQAWELARPYGEIGLAVDAAHMVAITFTGTQEAVDWNQVGLDLARTSSDAKAKALIPAMLNNSAWDLFDMEDYPAALPHFEEALAEWQTRDQSAQIRIAEWSLARCLRALGRCDESLSIQLNLARDNESAGKPSAFVFEELAELMNAMGRPTEAESYRTRAAALKSMS